MNRVVRHIAKSFVAGIVALLPIAGTAITVFYLETSIANPWVREQPWYFPGLGLLGTGVVLYVIGLTVSTFLGRWAWRTVDRLLDNLPALGALYRTLKQVLGYGEGKEGLFEKVVLVPSREHDCVELGLVTNDLVDDSGKRMLSVFVPGSPTPTAGRLLLIEAKLVHHIDIPVNEALKALVSLGKTSLTVEAMKSRLTTERSGTGIPPAIDDQGSTP